MTEHAHQAQPDEQLDPAVADRLAAAQAYLRAHSPLLTPQARASMLQRVREQAAAQAITAAQLADTALATAPASQRSRPAGASPVDSAGSLLTRQRLRRAQAFADALADASAPTAADREHDTYAPDRRHGPDQGTLIALADALQGMPRPVLDPEAKAVQRAQLIAAMEAALADGTLTTPPQPGRRETHRRAGSIRPRSAWSRAIAAGGLSVGVAAGAFGGVAASSTEALPGDTLYGLKRGMENMRLNLADDDADRGKVYLDLASTRLQEAYRLMERGRGGELDDESVGEIRKALSGMQQEASEGHRLLAAAYRRDGSLQSIETLSAFSSNHRRGWTELRDRLPSRLDDVSDEVTSVFDAIQSEVAPLRSFMAPGTDPADVTLTPLLPGLLPRSDLDAEDHNGD